MTKYRATPTVVDGVRFDSKAEARRYGQLILHQKAGDIKDLELQPAYPLVVEGEKIAVYRADFRYFDKLTGKHIVEDVKSAPTAKRSDYRMKKKLLKAIYGIEVREVMNP